MEVWLSSEAAKQLDELSEPIHARMLKIIVRLSRWPHVSGAKPLRGELSGHFRMRTGDYRLQFTVDEGRVLVERIGHRDRFYEE